MVYQVDGATNQIQVIGFMPVSMETKGDIIDGKLYIVGGFNGEVSAQIFIYDIDSDEWLDPITMPLPNSANSVTAIGSELYIIGDFANLDYTAKYNTVTNEFSILESNIQPRRHCATENVDGTLWVMGGNTASNISTSLDNVQYTDILSSNQEVEINTEISISPNPANNIIRFSSPISNIKIINAIGQIVSRIIELNDEIHVSALAGGVYYILADSDDGLVSLKWIKQ